MKKQKTIKIEPECHICNDGGVIKRQYFNGKIVESCRCKAGKELDEFPNLRPCWVQD